MATSAKRVVTFVGGVKGKFGPQVKDKDGKYYSFGKFYKGDQDLNGTFEADVFESDKGYLYLNGVSGVAEQEIVEEIPKRKATAAKVKATKFSSGERDYDREAFGKIKSLFLAAIMPQFISGVMQDDEVRTLVRKWSLYAMEDDR